MNFLKRYDDYKEIFEAELKKRIETLNSSNETLKDAMVYSLTVGGKRIRPVIMLAVAELLCVDLNKVLPFAVAIECIHTYSLIHDDLPAMDNDDLRRGKPTNHKVFGEAMAILAGDALLNYAYELILRSVTDNNSLSAGRLLALYAGAFGMVGGQALDILSENTVKNEETLYKIHENKTGKLLLASTLVPSCLAGNAHFDKLSEYGKNLGLLFQVTDDILDVVSSTAKLGKSINKDADENKLTFVTLYGLDGAKSYADKYYGNAKSALSDLEDNEFLLELLNFIKDREY
ncbi:MAG: polyprenyl synthetase family protein [Clostridia bacterium]|nr:polyprenyl synthetase family protein [Clostridia bacterium]